MDNIVSGWQCPLCKTVYSPLVSSCTCSTNIKESQSSANEANWLIWGGWKGNHNQRIEEAKCSKCGFIHKTVYSSVDNLSKLCPSCNSRMGVIES